MCCSSSRTLNATEEGEEVDVAVTGDELASFDYDIEFGASGRIPFTRTRLKHHHKNSFGIFKISENESGSTKVMNSRSSSVSLHAPRQRPTVTSRLSFAISNAEHGEAASAPTNVEHQIDEEIEKIKRYEVCAHDLAF